MDNLSPNHLDHPSNELHNAAYPTSDYQPSNQTAGPSSSSSSAASPQNAIGRTGTAGRTSGKFAELAVPSLATTSARDPGWQHDDVNIPVVDTSLGPPPSYEQSQSQSQSSRPNTSHHAGSSQSGTGTTSVSLSPASPNTTSSINSTSPLRPPASTYQTISRSSVERAGSAVPPLAPPAATAAATTAAVAVAAALPSEEARQGSSSGPDNRSPSSQGTGFDVATKHFDHMKRRRRRKWWCIVLVGLVVFIVALCIGVYIGVRGIGNKDDHDRSPPDWEKKYRQPNHPPWNPSWSPSTASPTSTVYIIVEDPEDTTASPEHDDGD